MFTHKWYHLSRDKWYRFSCHPNSPGRERTLTIYRYLPKECKAGKCDHEPERCTRYRSRQCLSGECSHARQNLLCAINYPEN